MRRTLTWLVAMPFAAASVLVGHAIAYRALGMPVDDLHGYLAHAPQVVLILATLALVGLAADARARRSSPVPVASLAVVAFVAQEHLERLIHTGHVPFLLASPVLWLGIALQLPVAFAVWPSPGGSPTTSLPPCDAPFLGSPRLLVLRVAGVPRPSAAALVLAHPGARPSRLRLNLAPAATADTAAAAAPIQEDSCVTHTSSRSRSSRSPSRLPPRPRSLRSSRS